MRALALLSPALLLALAACSSSASVREGEVVKHYRAEAGLPATGLPASTKELLADRGWSRLPKQEAAAMLEAAAQGDPSLRLELADLHFLSGGKSGALHAARNAWTWMSQASPRNGPEWERALRLYNAAVTACALDDPELLAEYDGVLASWRVPSGGFRTRVVRDGIGAPILAIRQHTEERDASDPYLPPIDVGVGYTAMLNFGGARPSLQLHDPLVEESVTLFGEPIPLAADFTAPLAYLYEQTDAEAWERRSMRHPTFDDAGIVLIEPVHPRKIPVLFVHGLKASPADFRWMINELRADPEIRRHYQFIAYRYPGSLPLPLLAVDMRDRLKEFWSWFDERAPGARVGGYAVVAHGLGGLLAKTLAVRSGNEIFDAVFRVPRDQVDFSGKLGETLSRTLFLEPDPKLGRVIFLAVPHRGTPWAEGAGAEATLMTIRIPESLLEARDAVEKRWGPQLRPEVRSALYGKTSAIQNMRPGDGYVEALARLKVEVPFDSVIGNLLGIAVEPTTDGVVAYSSAHLEGAESESVIRGNHDVHRSKQGIEVVREILKKHIQ